MDETLFIAAISSTKDTDVKLSHGIRFTRILKRSRKTSSYRLWIISQCLSLMRLQMKLFLRVLSTLSFCMTHRHQSTAGKRTGQVVDSSLSRTFLLPKNPGLTLG